jgi:hypothetical protein
MRITLALFLVVSTVLCPLRSSAQTGKVETLGALSDSAVPESIRQVLAEQGYRIFDGTNPAEEIWFRKEIPTQPKNAGSDAVYDGMAESALIGVVHFVKGSNDYRDQSVAAGFYTVRFALMPNDGNHLGVAPSRDFLLLVPVSADPGPQAAPKFQDLVALSRKASGTKHPAPLSLVPAESATVPGISQSEEGHSVFTSKVHLASGEDLSLALVVKGTAPQ